MVAIQGSRTGRDVPIVAERVFPFLRQIGGDDSTYSHHMRDARFTIPTPVLLSKVVDMLDDLPMEGRDTKGDVYEYMLSKIASAGQNGQFRTPRHIIALMVAMTAPMPKDEICDPACGTAGFLIAAGEHVRRTYPDVEHDQDARKHFHNSMFHGFDFDSTMLRIGSMNMLLHGVEAPDIRYRDSLSEGAGEEEGLYSLVLANPPFAGSLDYESTAQNLLRVVKTKKTELLFLALFLRLLRPGGRAAVIVPEGVLFGSSKAHKELRRILVEDQKLDAIVKLPSGVFRPYAGVSTAIVLFTKTDSGGTDDVWFYEVAADGWSLNDKRTPLLDEAALGCDPVESLTPEEHAKNNLPDVLARWSERDGAEREGMRTNQSFCVPKDEIVAEAYDLSLSRYKEHVYEEIEYRPPDDRRARGDRGRDPDGVGGAEGDVEVTTTRVELATVAAFVRGVTFKPDDVTSGDEVDTVACMRTSNVQKVLDTSSVWRIPNELVKRSDQYLLSGDILVSSANSWNLVGKCCWIPDLPGRTTFGGFVSALRVDPTELDPRYAYWWFSSPRTQHVVRSFGRMTTSISNLDLARCLRLTIPLPGLDEQRRIARVLDTADAVRKLRERSMDHAAGLAGALYRDLFDDSSPVGVVSLGEVADVASGITKGRRTNGQPLTEVPYLSVSNVQDGHLDMTRVKRIEASKAEIARYRLKPGDLLLTEGGDPDKLGRGTLWSGELDVCIHQNHVFRVRVRDRRVLDPVFLRAQAASPAARSYFLRAAKQTTGIASINRTQLRALPLLIPPVQLQRSFADRLRVVEVAVRARERHLTQLNALFASLQHRAFTGAL